MRAQLERTYHFEAAHFLPCVPSGHKCARVHGHSYVIEVTIEGVIDDDKGWVMDFADIDTAVRPLIKRLDHQLLNEIDGLTNPTSELLAAWLWQRLMPLLPMLTELRVKETQHSRCIIRADKWRLS